MVAIQTTDYIMDVVSSMERQGIKFSLCFRRVLWLQGLRLDNELLVNVVYFQVNPVKMVLLQADHSIRMATNLSTNYLKYIYRGNADEHYGGSNLLQNTFEWKCYEISPNEMLT